MLHIQQFLTKNGVTPMPHPPYSPDLTLSNFYFASLDEKILKGKHFAGVEEMKQKMAEVLKGIKSDEFKSCFEQWKNILISIL